MGLLRYKGFRLIITDLISEEVLYELHKIQKLSTTKIATIYNLNRDSIRRLLKKYNIKPNSNKEYSHIRPHNKKHHLWRGHGEISSSFFNFLKIRSKRKNIEFNLTIEYIWDIFLKQNKKCKYSLVNLQFAEINNDFKNKTASLDRIDSSKGYIEGNVQWVHKDVNFMKYNLTELDFLRVCKNVTIFQKNKNFTKCDRPIYTKCEFLNSIRCAKKRNIEFNLTIDDIIELYCIQGGICALSGVPIKFSESSRDNPNWTVSIDRVDSSKNYTIDNIQLIHKKLNPMKLSFSQKYFINLCNIIYENSL